MKYLRLPGLKKPICFSQRQDYRRAKIYAIAISLMLLGGINGYSQNFVIENPSLEGPSQASAVPKPWILCGRSPDTQPGECCNISKKASNGNTYVGMLCDSAWDEGIALAIKGYLKAGHAYSLSFDLAYPPLYYVQKICNGSLAIYGGNKPGEKTEKLWESGPFYNTDWKRFTAVLIPSGDCQYLSFYPYFTGSCNGGRLSGALIDNFSPSILEVPQVIFTVRNTCKGENSGEAMVRVIEGEAPYSYNWQPGEYTTNRITNLSEGVYDVTVTAANGGVTKGQIVVKESDLRSDVTTVSSKCYHDNENQIMVNTSGGQPPYRYFLNGDIYARYNNVFNGLSTGNYDLVVLDEQGCKQEINNIKLEEPPPVQARGVITRSVSCSDVKDGKIIITADGGTPPYAYSLNGYQWQRDSLFAGLDAGQYTYWVRDSRDCSAEGETTIIKEQRFCAVFLPTAFSPNGDGINDLFRAKVHDAIHDYHMAVYGRWGQLVFETNDPDRGWDGSQKGVSLPAGSYLWMVTYTDNKNQPRKQQGNLVLVR